MLSIASKSIDDWVYESVDVDLFEIEDLYGYPDNNTFVNYWILSLAVNISVCSGVMDTVGVGSCKNGFEHIILIYIYNRN